MNTVKPKKMIGSLPMIQGRKFMGETPQKFIKIRRQRGIL